MEIQRVPLELAIELVGEDRYPLRLTKTLYAGFIPQHGMQVMDTEILFRVTTVALAGLQNLRHTATPLRRGNFVEGSRKVTSKLFPKDEEKLKESVEFFINNGWKLER